MLKNFFFVAEIKETKNENWFENEHLSCTIPFSQSVSNQLVYRNGKLVNLPLNLIVEGDILVIKPGQTVNINCRSIEKTKVIF